MPHYRTLQIAMSMLVLCGLASNAAAQEIKVTLLGTGTPI